jgi:myo-inositol catabolism protein IolS
LNAGRRSPTRLDSPIHDGPDHDPQGVATGSGLPGIETTVLARTGLRVSRLCIGGLQAVGSDPARFMACVQRGIAMGVNFIDTASAYGDGHSESLIGKAIEGQRDRVVIATKFGFDVSRPADVRLSLERSLRCLRTDYIDVFQQHWPSPDVPLADTIGALEQLKTEGKIRAIGVSNWMEPEWEELGDSSRIDSLQACQSLLWRSIESHVLPLCRKAGIAVLAYSPLCQGILSGRFKALVDLSGMANGSRRDNRRLQPDNLSRLPAIMRVLTDVATNYGRTPAQTALRWLLDQPGITAVIAGSSSVEQMEENLGALGWRLDSDDWRKLSDATLSMSADLGPTDTLWGWHPKTVGLTR